MLCGGTLFSAGTPSTKRNIAFSLSPDLPSPSYGKARRPESEKQQPFGRLLRMMNSNAQRRTLNIKSEQGTLDII
jgi:hypothetical protein